MTDEELDRLQALCDAATPGPWVMVLENWGAERGDEVTAVRIAANDDPVMVAANFLTEERPGQQVKDYSLMAASREAIPALVAEVRRLRRLCDHYAAVARGREAEGQG